MIKFSYLPQVGAFFGTPVSTINKSNRHEIIEISLKVALNSKAEINDCMSWFVVGRKKMYIVTTGIVDYFLNLQLKCILHYLTIRNSYDKSD